MKFLKVESPKQAATALAESINNELLNNKKVLWLVAGGSNIAISVIAAAQLSEKNSQNLSIILTDERYGPVGHSDSNWQQLMAVGFKAINAKLIPTLNGKSFEETIKSYDRSAKNAFESADSIIGQFGMGADGHVAGILPNSSAAEKLDANEWVIGYQAPPFTRLTLSPSAISKVTTAFLIVFGPDKLPALEKLKDQSLSISEQPVQILKSIPSLTVINDQLGEN